MRMLLYDIAAIASREREAHGQRDGGNKTSTTRHLESTGEACTWDTRSSAKKDSNVSLHCALRIVHSRLTPAVH